VELTVNLPDPLAKEAKAAGLLGPQAIEKLLRMQLRNHPEYGSPLYRQYLI